MREILFDDLGRYKPLDPDDEDFAVALDAMRKAQATALLRGHRDVFWYVDRSMTDDPSDMVAVVDLVSLGNIVKGTNDWPAHAERVSVTPIGGADSTNDVLESLVAHVRACRVARSPSP